MGWRLSVKELEFMLKLIFIFAAVLLAGCAKSTEAPSQVTASTATNRQVFQVKGVIQEIKLAESQAIIRHGEIPNYMPAMTMPLEVKNTNEFAGLKAGDEIV